MTKKFKQIQKSQFLKETGKRLKKPIRPIYFHSLIYNEKSWRTMDIQHYTILKSTLKFPKIPQKNNF